MDTRIQGARDVLTRLCRHRYSWPDYSCFTLVQEMAVWLGRERPDVSAWTAGGSEYAAAKAAAKAHGSVEAAFAHEVAAASAEGWPWTRQRCSAQTPCHVGPGDVVLLRPGLMTANAYRTVAHHVGLIGPECRPWVWTPPRPAVVTDQWGPPLVHMRLTGGDD